MEKQLSGIVVFGGGFFVLCVLSKFLNEDDFKEAVFDHLAKPIYEDLNKDKG